MQVVQIFGDFFLLQALYCYIFEPWQIDGESEVSSLFAQINTGHQTEVHLKMLNDSEIRFYTTGCLKKNRQ